MATPWQGTPHTHEQQQPEWARCFDAASAPGVTKGAQGSFRGFRSLWRFSAGSAPAGKEANITRACTNDSELHRLADRARSGFKRPSWWVLIFGWSLAACAGSVNSICFRSFGHFVSHATGGTTSIALGIEGVSHGRHGWEEPMDAARLIISFVVGAFACGLLIDKNQVHFGGKSLYGAALVGNSLLLASAVGLFSYTGDGLAAACFASCACGLQNAMCTSHFGAVIRTTHVTGTLTDIGSTIGRMTTILLRNRCRRAKLNVLERAEVGVDARKLLVLGPMWLSFFLGTMVGAYTWSHMDVYALLLPAGLTFFVGIAYTLFRPQMKNKLKNIERNRLRKELGEISDAITRSQSFILDVKRHRMRAAESGTVIDLEEEFGHMLETMHQVESDLEDLYHEGDEDEEQDDEDEVNCEEDDDDSDDLDVEAGRKDIADASTVGAKR